LQKEHNNNINIYISKAPSASLHFTQVIFLSLFLFFVCDSQTKTHFTNTFFDHYGKTTTTLSRCSPETLGLLGLWNSSPFIVIPLHTLQLYFHFLYKKSNIFFILFHSFYMWKTLSCMLKLFTTLFIYNIICT
jgi:hypothetical protein